MKVPQYRYRCPLGSLQPTTPDLDAATAARIGFVCAVACSVSIRTGRRIAGSERYAGHGRRSRRLFNFTCSCKCWTQRYR